MIFDSLYFFVSHQDWLLLIGALYFLRMFFREDDSWVKRLFHKDDGFYVILGIAVIMIVMVVWEQSNLKDHGSATELVNNNNGELYLLSVIFWSFIGGFGFAGFVALSFTRVFFRTEVDVMFKEEEVVEEVEPEPVEESKEDPFTLSSEDRFRHTLLLGSTGHGKTSQLGDMISSDVHCAHSTIVFDSQGDLIDKIARIDIPRERIIIIDPTDVEYPPALGLFDFKTQGKTAYEREERFNTTIELITFVINSLLSSEITGKQDVPFRYVIRLCLEIPDATILTFAEIFQKNGLDPYWKYVERLSPAGQNFFKNQFQTRQYQDTKDQIIRRVDAILSIPTMERMFSQPHTKIDMGKAMDEGCIILINSAKKLLKEEGSAFFSRFMVALISQAVQSRTVGNNTPAFVYIDEAAPVIDSNIANLLETARKYQVGITLAFQSLGQIPNELQHSVITNTGIKMVGGLSAKDARALSGDMQTDADTLMRVPKLQFFTHVKGGRSVYMRTHPGTLDNQPQRTDMHELIIENRQKFCIDAKEEVVYVPDEKVTILRAAEDHAPYDDTEQFNKT